MNEDALEQNARRLGTGQRAFSVPLGFGVRLGISFMPGLSAYRKLWRLKGGEKLTSGRGDGSLWVDALVGSTWVWVGRSKA